MKWNEILVGLLQVFHSKSLFFRGQMSGLLFSRADPRTVRLADATLAEDCGRRWWWRWRLRPSRLLMERNPRCNTGHMFSAGWRGALRRRRRARPWGPRPHFSKALAPFLSTHALWREMAATMRRLSALFFPLPFIRPLEKREQGPRGH